MEGALVRNSVCARPVRIGEVVEVFESCIQMKVHCRALVDLSVCGQPEHLAIETVSVFSFFSNFHSVYTTIADPAEKRRIPNAVLRRRNYKTAREKHKTGYNARSEN